MSNKYTILSIGPIYDSLMLADNTRAIWTVSFMFSYVMKETIRELQANYKDKFLVPNVANDEFQKYMNDKSYLRIGVFHDRLIIKDECASEVNNAFQAAISKFCNEMIEPLFKLTNGEIKTFDGKEFKFVKTDVDIGKAKAYFKAFFQSYIAQVDVPSGKNPILELSKYMDAVEYHPSLPPHEEEEFLFLFLRLSNLGALQETAFGKEAFDVNKERCFKSLPEIAAWELMKDNIAYWKKNHLCLKIKEAQNLKDAIKNPNDEAEEIFTELKNEFKDRFKPYHKYVAIVHADGDAFGKYLEKMGGDEEKIKVFSDRVFGFVTDARDAIGDYGGYPVVGSGEDLVFFAPVINGSDNIFTLIHRIDKIFKRLFDDDTLSMSYGVSISYYKFPLQESLEISKAALWDHAKESKWINRDQNDPAIVRRIQDDLPAKNAVHINIQKHSGQSHSLTLRKGTKLYCQFVKLLLQELSPKESLHLPHSLHHSLSRVDMIIDEIAAANIEHFFKNMFNENVHKSKHKKALNAVVEILKELKEGADSIHLWQEDTKKIAKPSKVIFSMLSIIKMLRGDA